MRVVFVNLHINGHLGPTLRQIITKHHPMPKLRYFLDYLLEQKVDVADYVTYRATMMPTKIAVRMKNLKFLEAEAKYEIKRMGLPADRITVMTDPKEIKSDDIVIYYPTFENPETFDTLKDVAGIKIMDHIHFYGEKERSDQLKGQNFQYYMFDVDLCKYSKMFQKNYAWFNGKYIMRPYTYQPRFCVKVPFSQRKTKAVAMGTVTKRQTPEFIAVNGSDSYQPRRKMIFENAEKYTDEIDSLISEFQPAEQVKTIKAKDNAFIKAYKKCVNFFQYGQQKSYFSFDVVDKYNEYKMFICPEDIHGSYGVGMVEGMACGCALIGADYGGYEDIGLVAGKSYIAYDGTMEDLAEKIRYYQKPENQAELEQIARTGCEYIRKNFSEKAAGKRCYEALKNIVCENEASKGKKTQK